MREAGGDGDSCAWVVPNPKGSKLSFKPELSHWGSFNIKIGALAPSWKHGTETLSFCLWSQAEAIEISSFLCCRGPRSVPYPISRRAALHWPSCVNRTMDQNAAAAALGTCGLFAHGPYRGGQHASLFLREELKAARVHYRVCSLKLSNWCEC